MCEKILREETTELSRERAKRRWILRIWLASWVLWGPSVQAEILYDEEGVQLQGTARIVAYNAATCQVLEESHTEARYEQIKANDGQPLHVWRLDYSVHNRTGKGLSYLRADFEIESEHPPCTNWTGEGPGGGPAGGPYSDTVFWGNHSRTLSTPAGMSAGKVEQGVLFLAVFHTGRPSFERWSTQFTYGEPEGGGQRPEPLSGIPAPSSGSPEPASGSPLPVEVRLDKYLLEAEMLSEEKDREGTLEALDRIAALRKEHDLELPEEFAFRYAKTALSVGSYGAAIDSVNTYLRTAGRDGEFYREALELLVQAEKEEERRKQAEAQEQRRAQIRSILQMVVIPAGRFRMGCVSGRDCDDKEQPVHEVRVEAFELGKYEVTFEEYDRFTAATGRARADDEGWGRGRHPVTRVSWEDAVAYTRWLSEQTGERYRLPMEAEWEYAARAGSETSYSWGNEIGRNRANCDGCGSQWDDEQTAPVGSFAPNGWGLHDMHGNVWEWVQDCWNDSYGGAPTDGSAWESGDCSRRVLRGGSWGSFPRYLRSAFRGWNSASYRNGYFGFRVARTITP